MGVAQQGNGELVVQAVRSGAGHKLVQDGERVPHGTSAGADNERKHARRHGDIFLPAEQLQVRHQRLGRHEAERVVVCTGTDGADDLVRLRGGKNEFDVFRRLFDDLEQGVEAG
ncbi:hypothetical protein BJQ89_01369 [Arthrobacter sp. ES1]|nr:hypothetical protein [Arthrobacter sp. ES1]